MIDPARLSGPAARALDFVVERNVEMIGRALDAVAIPSSAYALGIGEAEEVEDLMASIVVVGLDVDRRRALSELSPYRAFVEVWRIWEFGVELEVDPPAPTPEFEQAAELVVTHVRSAGLDDPSRVVFNALASRLTRERPVVPATDDFLAFAYHEGPPDQLLANLEAAATPAVAATLRAKQLLPHSWQKLDGAPRLR